MFTPQILLFQALLLAGLSSTAAIDLPSSELPFVKLPYGSYQASSYDAVNDVIISLEFLQAIDAS
jgi:hypothetical protein